MIISHKYKFIFICNGRTGTTSIEKTLAQLDESCDMNNGADSFWANKHIPPTVLKSFLPTEIWSSYFKFVFVRHPLDWFISAYCHSFPIPRFLVKPIIRRPAQALNYIQRYMKAKELSSRTVFTVDDVNFLFQQLRFVRGMPCSLGLMQSNYVYDPDGNIIVDFIGRLEELQNVIEKIKSKIGIEFDLPHLNKSENRSNNDSFTFEASRLVKELWAVDFRNYGYQ